MTTIDKIKQEFETLKGQFVITQSHKIERLVAIGDDQQDYYWITYDGRKFTWNTCVGGLIPLKGYLQDKDYNSFVISARLNHFDQETCWGEQGENSQKHKNELMKVSGNDTILTEVCWNLETI
jgi:hypothetical protein